MKEIQLMQALSNQKYCQTFLIKNIEKKELELMIKEKIQWIQILFFGDLS